MSASLYQSELTNIISESKRKNQELRSAAEKALQEIKAITVTSEQQLAADLASNNTFTEPFLKACTTGSSKLAVSGVNGLQRLIISRGLPKDKLNQALQALDACTELGLDIQLKVLQALPALIQNYAEELTGDLLSSALQVCASLQGAKVSTVSAVAAATLQQLVTAVFSRLAAEDSHYADVAAVAEIPGDKGTISLRPAAYDAYRVFQDLVLAAQDRKTKFVQFTLSREECLELIESSMQAKPRLIANHDELASIIRSHVIPLVTTAVSEQLSFPVTVRCIRIIRLLCTRLFPQFVVDLDTVLALVPHALEPDAVPWRRTLLMEVLREMFAEHGLIVMAYMAFDQDGKTIIQDLLASFVRLSSERPAIIGLGQQSTTPAGPSTGRDREEGGGDGKSGMSSMLSSFGAAETSIHGISTQWSIPRSACYEHLDKAEAPVLPETYVYALMLECLNGLSESLAKVVLPLTVHHDRPRSAEQADHRDTERDSAETSDSWHHNMSVPLNPLELQENPSVLRAKSVAALIENCWPAVLATCSTFLNAALDDGLYRTLIKSYQRFTQVAGLLRLSTPRDALMTTLGKSAVPPQVLNAVAASGDHTRSPTAESPRIFSSSKNLLSIESFVSQASSSLSLDKDSRSSMDGVKPGLTVRNLLCLRALLNLAIALGPTLGSAFAVVVDVLKQADIVLSTTGAQHMARSATFSSPTQSDPPALVQSFSAEVSAVEVAASRLLESTADYPDDAFVVVLDAFCRILRTRPPTGVPQTTQESSSASSTPLQRQRTFSGLPGVSTFAELQAKNYQFALPKLATLAALNVHRFRASSPEDSGWQRLTEEVLAIAIVNSSPANARRSATDLLCKLSAECISAISQEEGAARMAMQLRCFTLLLGIVRGIYTEEGQLTATDLEVQGHVISAIRAILERSGDTIIAGWDKLLAIVSTTFDSEDGLAIVDDGVTTNIEWPKVSSEFVSARLGREAFGTLQLICADFLSLLPLEIAPSIIELLSRFMIQADDLNLSLTGINIAWNVSDMLFDSREADVQLPAIPADNVSAIDTALSASATGSRTIQWLLSLTKLRRIVHRGQHEPAKAAFQTICSISRTNGSHIPINVWEFLLKHTLIGVLADEVDSPSGEDELATVLLAGIGEVLAQQITLLGQLPDLKAIWTTYLNVIRKLLDKLQLSTVCAVYQNLTTILMQIDTGDARWHEPIVQTASIWAQRDPSQVTLQPSTGDDQPAFRAYASLGSQLLRLRKADIDAQFAHAVIKNLTSCVKSSHASFYGADLATLSPLQREVVETLKALSTDLEDISSELLAVAIEFCELHSHVQSGNGKPSFVALSVAAIEWLQTLVTRSCQRDSSLDGAAIEHAIRCLANLVEEKYQFQVESKEIWLWRRATSAALDLSGTIMSLLDTTRMNSPNKIETMTQYVKIIRNVTLANGIDTFKNDDRIYDDETDDIAAFVELCTVVVPALHNDVYPQELRISLVKSLFEASIIHALERGETQSDPLQTIDKVRRGRVRQIVPSKRERMSYEAFGQLIGFASSTDGAQSGSALALAAAPWLMLRLAVPIRAYIADQPLRSRMPQPLSELEELLYSFEQIKRLNIDHDALGKSSNDGPSKLHWQYLYPLLAKAIRVAGDKWCGSEEVLSPLQGVLEALET